jgi:hypothetical protein
MTFFIKFVLSILPYTLHPIPYTTLSVLNKPSLLQRLLYIAEVFHPPPTYCTVYKPL